MAYQSKIIFLACSLALGACSHYSEDLSSVESRIASAPSAVHAGSSPQDIAPAAGGMSAAVSQGDYSQFHQSLAKGYCDMARYENDKAYDYKAAKIFTEKAVLASKGKTFAPVKLSDYDLSSDRLAELKAARARLVDVLKDPAAVQVNQEALAKAQTSFDCWVERAEEATKDEHYAQCRGEFEQAMTSVSSIASIAPAAGGFATPNILDVHFVKNSAVLDSGAPSAIEQVAMFLTSPQAAGYNVVLTGFTDTSVASEYATKLATSRVFAVRDALIAKGVSDARIRPQISSAPGASVMQVSTDGVPAQPGRRVQIFLQSPAAGMPVHGTTTVR